MNLKNLNLKIISSKIIDINYIFEILTRLVYHKINLYIYIYIGQSYKLI